MSPLTDAISAALIHSLWQDSMIAIVLWAGLIALRGRSARARYAASGTALGFMVLVPIVTTAMLYLRALAPEAVSPVVTDTVRLLAAMPRAFTSWTAPGGRDTAAWIMAWRGWALPVWSAGVLVCSVRLVWGGAHACVLRRRSAPADPVIQSVAARLARRMGVDRSVPVLVCTIANGPATLGWLRPVILLPSAAALGITPGQLEALLAHELAHIRRHDYVVNVLQLLAETMCFYHPAVWWASTHLRLERELCCDDVTVATCGDAVGYARALTHLAKLRVTPVGVALGATSGPLVLRVGRLLGAPTPRGSRWPALLAVCLAVATGLVNGTWIRLHAQDDATSVVSGLWEIRPGLSADAVQLRLCYADEFSRDEVPVDRLEGFASEWLSHDGPMLFFTLRRDAGVFSFDGTIRDGVGVGTYRFEPSANFPADLARRGFEPPTFAQRARWPGLGSWIHTLAVYDIGVPVFDELRAGGVARPDYPRLVSSAHVRALRAEIEGRVRVPSRRPWC